jgi:hypothetical protein
MTTITLNDHGTVVRFQQLGAQLANPAALTKVVGREARNQLVTHFRRKHRSDVNRLNPARRQNFWLQVAQSVSQPLLSTGGLTVTISIADPRFAQKVFGGTITAKRTKNLSLPVSPDAYGRTTKTFEAETGLKLFLLQVGGKKKSGFSNAMLATARGGGIQVEYLLTPSVTQDADPTALPNEAEFSAALVNRAEKHVARKTAEANGQATAGGAE